MNNNNNNSVTNSFSIPPFSQNTNLQAPADGERRSRWDAPGNKAFIPGVPLLIPRGLGKDVMDTLLLRVRIEEITHRLSTGQLGLDDPTIRRSPSPPPRYDAQGKRVNTREQRTREKLGLERQELIQAATKINPAFKPPGDYKPISVKKSLKIAIPIDKYPDYNFIGLIIGPRGETHKQMEKKSGCKISIRGKGSQKEGQTKKQQLQGDEDEDLHVLVTGDTEKQLLIAKDMIEKLLVPIDDSQNEHKQLQLRKLAEFNGTLRDNFWNRPEERRRFGEGREITCSFCGEPSHPTSDCPLKGKPGVKSKMDQEYESFLSMIGEGSPKRDGDNRDGGNQQDAASFLDTSYQQFMSSIGQAPSADRQQPPPPQQQPRGADMDSSYEQFMASIGQSPARGSAGPAGGAPPPHSYNPYGMPPPQHMGMQPPSPWSNNPYGAPPGYGSPPPPGTAASAPPPWAQSGGAAPWRGGY